MRPDDRYAGVALRSLLAAIATLHLLLSNAPWRFHIPTMALDSSWAQVIAHAAALGWQWGSDIAFTYGPLGYLRTPTFDDALLAPVLLWNGLLVVAVIVGVVGVLRNVSISGAVALYLVIAFAASARAGHGAFMTLPLFAAFLYFRAPESPARVPTFLLIAAGVYANVYTSMLALGLVTSAIMDVSRLLSRRVPLFTLVFASVVFGAFVLAGQEPGSFPTFLRSVVEVVSGYADAMAIHGNLYETIAFLGVSAAGFALILGSEWPRLADPQRRADACLLVVAVAAFWYVIWKSGFVRHDLHSIFSWRTLAIGLAAYVAVRWTGIPSRALRAATMVLAFISCCAAVFAGSGEISASQVWKQAGSALFDIPLRTLRQGLAALAGPAEWQGELRRSKDAAYAGMRHAFPDLNAAGTVDLVGRNHGVLLAHGVDYRPQPVFLAFVAYTPWLVELNRQHMRGARAASTLFVSNATIDNRYPLSDLGQSIVEVLTRYQPEDVIGDYVRLRLRPEASEHVSTELAMIDVGLGEWVPVRAGDAVIMLQAAVRPNVIGRLARFAWQLPYVLITVRLADGSERTHRIVPAIAADGFMLSPYADSAAIIAAQSTGRLPESHPNRVLAVRVDAESPSARRLFDDRAHMRLARLEIPAVSGESVAPALQRFFDRRENVVRLVRSVAGKGQNVEARGASLFAHAPAAPEMMVDGGSTVRARYGIFEGAWSGEGRTDGVCFRIRSLGTEGQSITVHERCLAPLERVEDRIEQETIVHIGESSPVRLVFETDCRATCSWDWSYWKDIDVTR